MPDDIRNKALEIIAKGADPFWLKIDSNALKQRQKVLDKQRHRDGSSVLLSDTDNAMIWITEK